MFLSRILSRKTPALYDKYVFNRKTITDML